MRFSAIIKRHPQTSIAYVELPFDAGERWGGRGRIPVSGTVGGAAFRTSVGKMRGRWLLPVSRALRQEAGVALGYPVDVVIHRDDEPRTIPPPPGLADALVHDDALRAVWDRSAYSHQREWAGWIAEAKRPATRERRVAKVLEALRAKGPGGGD